MRKFEIIVLFGTPCMWKVCKYTAWPKTSGTFLYAL